MRVFVVVCSALLLFLHQECFLLRVPFFARQGVAQKGAMGVFIFTPTPPGNDLEPVKLCSVNSPAVTPIILVSFLCSSIRRCFDVSLV